MKSENDVMEGLKFIINKYVTDDVKKAKYLNEINNMSPPPIRGIFSEIKKDGIEIKDIDSDLVHDAFFYFG